MGLRELKAARTREELSRVAIELFCTRGFDGVTMTEIAEAAEAGRATLFAYFPAKERLVLDRVRDDDPCRVFADRGSGVCLVEALRTHYSELAARLDPREAEGTKRIMELIMATPALATGLQRMFDHQRDKLAALLAAEGTSNAAGFTAQVVAAQTMGVVLAVKSRIYERLVAGEWGVGASADLVGEVDSAFGLLENGIGSRYPKEVG